MRPYTELYHLIKLFSIKTTLRKLQENIIISFGLFQQRLYSYFQERDS